MRGRPARCERVAPLVFSPPTNVKLGRPARKQGEPPRSRLRPDQGQRGGSSVARLPACGCPKLRTKPSTCCFVLTEARHDPPGGAAAPAAWPCRRGAQLGAAHQRAAGVGWSPSRPPGPKPLSAASNPALFLFRGRFGRMVACRRPRSMPSAAHPIVPHLDHMLPRGSAEVWVKLEAANPTGSYKDRMALAMIEGAERAGGCSPDRPSSSTPAARRAARSLSSAPSRATRCGSSRSNAFSDEKLRTMAAFGAELDVIDSPEGITPDLIPTMMERAAEIVAERAAYATDQFNNRDVLDGYRKSAPRSRTAPAPIDVLRLRRPAGCFLGAPRRCPPDSPGLSRVAVEPAESAVLSGGTPGTHRIEGGGVGSVHRIWEVDSTGGTVPTTPSRWPVGRRPRGRVERALVRRQPHRGVAAGGRLTRTARRDRPAGFGTEVPRRRPLQDLTAWD